MAGNSFSRSTKDGSDFVFECTPCAADGPRVEALQFCRTCNQFLCDTCTKYHKRLSKDHQLVPARSTKHPTTSANKSVLRLPKCRTHPDRDIEMFCGTHDMVYCLLCIAKDHRSCENVEEVQNGVHKPDASKLQKLVADIDRVNNALRAAKGKTFQNVKLLKTTKVSLLKEIDILRKEMNDHLDDLERNVKAELEEELAKLEQKLRDNITAADDLLTTTTGRKADLARNTDDKHMFIADKLGQMDVCSVNAFLTEAVHSENADMKFERNTQLYDCIKGAHHLGRIVRKSSTPRITKGSKYVVKSSIERNVKVDTDDSEGTVSRICQLQDGTILLADKCNSKLKRLDDQLNVKDYCNLQSSPVGLCSISSTEIVVRFDESMQFIHVGESLSPGTTFTITRLKWYSGNTIAFCDNNVWTFGDKDIYIYSRSGNLIKTIDRDYKGEKIFSHFQPESFAVHHDGSRVYVTTWEDSVVVFNKNGDLIQEIRDQHLISMTEEEQLLGTCGICITEDDIIVVAGSMSSNVFMFDNTGECLGKLSCDWGYDRYPWPMCYDRMKCRLLVGGHSNNVHIYELSE